MIPADIRRQIADAYRDESSAIVARRFGVSTQTVCCIGRAAGIVFGRGGKGRPRKPYGRRIGGNRPVESAVILALRAEGWTLRRLADQYGVTRQAIQQRIAYHRRFYGAA